jgi:hypothetical protein
MFDVSEMLPNAHVRISTIVVLLRYYPNCVFGAHTVGDCGAIAIFRVNWNPSTVRVLKGTVQRNLR